MTVFMGIDPGYGRVGYAVITGNLINPKILTTGIITTEKVLMSSRLQEIERDVISIISTYKPEICIVESLYFSRNTTTAMRVAEARGVILLTLSKAGIHIIETQPSSIKLAFTGYGKADKRMMKDMCTRVFRGLPKSFIDDAADALAMAYVSMSLYKNDVNKYEYE